MFRELRGQSLGEYVFLITIVTMTAMVMFTMIKRSTQSLIGTVADQIADQRNAEQNFSYNDSHITKSLTNMASMDQGETFDQFGKTTYVSDHVETTTSVVFTNAGFTAH